MRGTRDIIDALRGAAWWLLVVSVLLGPAGLGGAAAFAAAARTCGISCPCDQVHDDHAGGPGEHGGADPCDADRRTDPGHEDGEPCQDECPDGCPDCGCCPGIAAAVVSLPVAPGATSCTSAPMLAPVATLASGAGTDVFRPPRSLT